jgi:recombination protein RecA
MSRPATAFPFSGLALSPLVVRSNSAHPPRLDHRTLAGRLTELSGVGASAVLTLAFTVVREIQQRGEPVAWIMSSERLFYPPDVRDSGVDCEALVVVRVPDAVSIADSVAKMIITSCYPQFMVFFTFYYFHM